MSVLGSQEAAAEAAGDWYAKHGATGAVEMLWHDPEYGPHDPAPSLVEFDFNGRWLRLRDIANGEDLVLDLGALLRLIGGEKVDLALAGAEKVDLTGRRLTERQVIELVRNALKESR